MPIQSSTKDQGILIGGKLQYEATRTINGKSYLLSSSPSLLDHTAINGALADPALFWARALSPEHLATMLENSFCLGLYVQDSSDRTLDSKTESKTGSLIHNRPYHQIGLARLITDHVTIAWLTDVYVLPAYQGQGLGRWIISSLDTVLNGMPELRRAMLIAEMGKMIAEYETVMGCEIWENGSAVCMQKRGPAGGSLGAKSDSSSLQDPVT